MLKELWILIKLMFATHPSDILGSEMEVMTMKHFPFTGYRYMCWCGKVITRDKMREVIERFKNTNSGKISYNHEYIHAIQAVSEHGDNWPRYYLNYLYHWLKHNPLVKPSHACYYFNRYEVEAYAMERDFDYWKIYSRRNLRGKYTLRKPRKKWKDAGGTASAWKKFVKTL